MISQCLAEQLFAEADQLATDKSRYFVQPRPIIVNYRHFVGIVLVTYGPLLRLKYPSSLLSYIITEGFLRTRDKCIEIEDSILDVLQNNGREFKLSVKRCIDRALICFRKQS